MLVNVAAKSLLLISLQWWSPCQCKC